jgi:signal transduction histidine kinase
MGVLANFDLFSVGITVAATLVLGCSVYFSNPRSITNQTFLWFSLITALWGTVNYLSYQFSNPVLTLWLLRGILFLAVLQALFLYEFFSVFPQEERSFSAYHNYLLIPLVYVTALLTLTPLVFSDIVGAVMPGQVAVVGKGPGLILFAIVAVGLVVRSLYLFFRTFRHATGQTRRATAIILIGTALTFALIIFFNLIMATVFVDPRFVPLGALFMFPFVVFTAYAILREHLFSIKVAATAVLIFILSIVSFGDILFSDTIFLVLFRTGVFVFVLIFGISLIRSVLREVEQREKIQKLAEELELTNERQETLIHFISHEVKGFLTKDAAVFAAIEEGDFGAAPESMKPLITGALAEARLGVESVETILKASNLKKGTVTYTKAPFDLKSLVIEAIEKAKPVAQKKGLTLTFTSDGGAYKMMGDKAQIADHVLRNLIDNSINYTPSGSILVSLSRVGNKIVFAVKDTGVGITAEDKQRLFTEGGHGKDSQKVNTHSTGYGLYIAKQITEAQGGTIRAESGGAGKGSTFTVEFSVS